MLKIPLLNLSSRRIYLTDRMPGVRSPNSTDQRDGLGSYHQWKQPLVSTVRSPVPARCRLDAGSLKMLAAGSGVPRGATGTALGQGQSLEMIFPSCSAPPDRLGFRDVGSRSKPYEN